MILKKIMDRALPLMVVLALLAPFVSEAQVSPGPPDLPDWLEPRGIGVFELTGLLPDTYLQGTIISHNTGVGIVVYRSGIRAENQVVITTTIYPRFSTPSWATNSMLSTFGCLGQLPYYDHMGSVAPPSTLRIYDDRGADVTSQIEYMFITHMRTRQPSAGSKEYDRYPPMIYYGAYWQHPLPLGPDGLQIPANSGCRIMIPGKNYTSLTGVFTLTLDSAISASVTGVQSASFQSYIGPGSMGLFDPLRGQLQRTYGNRAYKIPLDIPPETNYLLLRFPPMPGDPFSDSLSGPPYNADRPTGGSYRLIVGDLLSTDLVFSAALPSTIAWRDAGLSPGSTFLPVMAGPSRLEAPEYILPAGIAYDPCFTQGNCSSAILQQIYQQTMTLQVIYLSVTAPSFGVDWTPLRMAGPAWSPAPSASDLEPLVKQPATADSVISHFSNASTATHLVFLPFIVSPPPGDPPNGCPCGWFDAHGRMVGYVPGP